MELQVIPFTSSQLGMLYESLQAGSAKYLSQALIHLNEELNIPKLINSIQTVFRKHLPLNIFSELENGSFEFKFGRDADFVVNIVDGYEENELEQFLLEDKSIHFNLNVSPLIRINLFLGKNGNNKLVFTYPHIILCATSAYEIISEVFLMYDFDQLPDREINVAEYLKFCKILSEKQSACNLQYWKDQFSGVDPLPLPRFGDSLYVESETAVIGNSIIAFNKDETKGIKAISRSLKASPNIFFQAILSMTLRAFVNRNTIVFGGTRSYDPRITKNLTGLFINTLPVKVCINKHDNLEIIINQLIEQHKKFKTDVYVDLSEIFSSIGISPGESLFDCVIDYKEKTLIDVLSDENHCWKNRQLDFTTETNDRMLIEVYGRNDVFEVKFNYDKRSITHEYASSFIDVFKRFIEITLVKSKQMLSIENYYSEFQPSIIEGKKSKVDLDIIDHFDEVAKSYNDECMYVERDKQYTFGEVHLITNAISHFMSDNLNLHAQDKLVVMIDRSYHYVLSIISCLKLNCIFIPVDPAWNPSRIEKIFKSIPEARIITVRKYIRIIPDQKLSQTIVFDEILDQIEANYSTANFVSSKRNPYDKAYVLYTSGTTGEPKGAINKHLSLNNRIFWMADYLKVTQNDALILKTPISFDVSLWEVLLPLVTGAKAIIVPDNKHNDIDFTTTLIASHDVTIAHFVPSVLEVFLNVEKNIYSRMDSLRAVICSGEALMPGLVNKFYEIFHAELHNLYGPTEAAIDVTSFKCERALTYDRVPIGSPIDNVKLSVSSFDLLPVPKYGIGELLIGEVAVGLGYINNINETNQKFLTLSDSGQETFYRTGDVASFVKNDLLICLGRIDAQVKVNGVRIELGEIDTLLLSNSDVKQAVSLVNENQIISFVIPADESVFDQTNLIGYLSEHLNENMLPSRIIKVDSFLLTYSGKLDKKSLIKMIPKQRPAQEDKVVSQLEQEVIDETLKILNPRVSAISIHDNLIALGITSLKAMSLAMILQKRYNIVISAVDILRAKNIYTLSQKISKLEQDDSAISTDLKEIGRLSQGQLSMWIDSQIGSNEPIYNMCAIVDVTNVSKTLLINTLKRLLDQNEILKTKVQILKSNPSLLLSYSSDEIIQTFDCIQPISNDGPEVSGFLIRPISLVDDKLCSIRVYHHGSHHTVLIKIHHIVCDGWSINILISELEELIANNGAELDTANDKAQSALSFSSFVKYEQNYLNSQKCKNDIDYWKKQLYGYSPIVLEVDHELDLGFAGERIDLVIDSNKINEFCSMKGITKFSFFLSLFFILLYQYSGCDDLTVGIPVAGRNSYHFENCVGLFINTILLRMSISPEIDFQNFLTTLIQQYQETLIHDQLPFNVLKAQLGIQSELAQVFFNYSPAELKFNSSVLNAREVYTKTAKVPLKLEIYESHGCLKGFFEYQKKYFSRDTVELMRDDFVRLLDSILFHNSGVKKIIDLYDEENV